MGQESWFSCSIFFPYFIAVQQLLKIGTRQRQAPVAAVDK